MSDNSESEGEDVQEILGGRRGKTNVSSFEKRQKKVDIKLVGNS